MVHRLSFFLLGLCGVLSPLGSPAYGSETPEPIFLRGDANGDGLVSQADIVSGIQSFSKGLLPPCADASDFDDSGSIDITDMINLVGFLYLKGRFPSPPFRTPGPDPTADDLGCESSPGTLPLIDPGDDQRGGNRKIDEDDGQVIDFIEFFYRRVSGYPGETEVEVPILLTNTTALDGFTVCVYADPSRIWLQKIELPGSFPGNQKPELSPLYSERVQDGYLARSVFMDYVPPFEGNKINRGHKFIGATLFFGISPEAKPGNIFRIQIADIPSQENLRPAPINEFVSDGFSVRPRLASRDLEVLIFPEGTLFIRGDPNRDFLLNITDIILILRYQFVREPLSCLDAADIDDSGSIDISDVVLLAEFLFGKGGSPAMPFPNPGLDPTNDPLGNCS